MLSFQKKEKAKKQYNKFVKTANTLQFLLGSINEFNIHNYNRVQTQNQFIEQR